MLQMEKSKLDRDAVNVTLRRGCHASYSNILIIGIRIVN
jgi:hypothetical protein